MFNAFEMSDSLRKDAQVLREKKLKEKHMASVKKRRDAMKKRGIASSGELGGDNALALRGYKSDEV